MFKMRELEKSTKRVSWVSDVNLCQVRLFLSDESPAQIGLGTQDHLQAKSTWTQPTSASFDDNLPPGFERSNPTDLLKNKLSQIPLPKWTLPPKFVFDITWQVVAGEESKEVELQNQRELRILEAVYPRPSAIPQNPIALTDIEPSPLNEPNVPLIPITPIEDEDTTIEDTSTYTAPQNATSAISHLAHCTTANTNSPIGANMIDPDLLMKILNDSKWQERLAATTNPDPVTNYSPPCVQTSGTEAGKPSLMTTPLNEPFYPPSLNDPSYDKSLIQQHGSEKSEGTAYLNDRQNGNHEMVNNMSKITKPCMYFNGPRGCRNGDNCPYQHDASDAHSAKRAKLDMETTDEHKS